MRKINTQTKIQNVSLALDSSKKYFTHINTYYTYKTHTKKPKLKKLLLSLTHSHIHTNILHACNETTKTN